MASESYTVKTNGATRQTTEGDVVVRQGTRDGAPFSADWFLARSMEGRVMIANSGLATTPVTFAGAYDADVPDFHLYVPAATLVVPIYIGVKLEAVGTESEIEIIGLASNKGDSSATGTAIVIENMRTDAPYASLCTATGSVDAAGITDPIGGTNTYEFWRRGHPLKDTAATGENDRHEQVYEWKGNEMMSLPFIVGEGSLAVYASAQASTGWIIVQWVEIPTNSVI